MSPTTRHLKKHVKARQRRRRTAQERLERDCRQAQHAATVLEQALSDLGLPEDLAPAGGAPEAVLAQAPQNAWA